jgi:hypothetical protein
MSDRRRTLFGGTALLEVTLLLLGIFLGFGIDAWWSERSIRLEVRRELSNVLSEFEVNRQLVDKYLNWHSRAKYASSELVRVLESDRSGSVAVPDSLIWGVGFTPTFDPRTGALRALLMSDRFNAVPSAQLRSALAGFDGFLRDAYDEEIRAREYTDSQVIPLLMQSGMIVRALSCEGCRDHGFPEGQETRLTNSVQLRTLVSRRGLFASLSIESLQVVKDQIESITRLTRSLLNGKG